MLQNGNIEEDKSFKFCHLNHLFTFRFNALPEVGQNRGLDLILDAHTNLVMKSSVVNSFQVIITQRLVHVCLFYFDAFSPLEDQTCACLESHKKKLLQRTHDPGNL